MTVRAASPTAAQMIGWIVAAGGSSSQTCLGRRATPCGSCLCSTLLTSCAPKQPQKTCSRSWMARSALGAPCAGAHPHSHFQPLAGAHPCPPAPTTPCCKRRHHTSFQLFSQSMRFHTALMRVGRARTSSRASGAGSGAGRSVAARDTADSAHSCQAVVLAALMSWSWMDVACLTVKWLAAMQRFPACSWVRTMPTDTSLDW